MHDLPTILAADTCTRALREQTNALIDGPMRPHVDVFCVKVIVYGMFPTEVVHCTVVHVPSSHCSLSPRARVAFPNPARRL